MHVRYEINVYYDSKLIIGKLLRELNRNIKHIGGLEHKFGEDAAQVAQKISLMPGVNRVNVTKVVKQPYASFIAGEGVSLGK